MRIAINAAFLGGRSEGIATYTLSVIEELAASGDDVIVYSPKQLTSGVVDSVKWRRTPRALATGGGRLAKFRASLWCPAALPFYALRDRARVLFCPSPEGMFIAPLPQVVVVHDLIPLFDPGTSRLRRGYFRYAVPLLLNASVHVIADSEHTKGDLVREFGMPENRIIVIYPWIDPRYFSDDPGVPPGGYKSEPYFLFVGRSSPHKNLGMVIRAFAEICDVVPQNLVCVLGFTGSRDQLRYREMMDLAGSLGVRDRLLIYSGISRAELLFLYRQATALVLLSKYEGFGYPPLEAMAVGTPAIVSDSTSLVEVSGPGAVCVPNTEPGPAAEAMKRLALDPGYRAATAEKGWVHARQFSRERSSRQIRSVLENSQAGARRASTSPVGGFLKR